MNALDESWKNASREAFEQQLALNKRELKGYPAHWLSFISFVNKHKPKTILDIGCGTGVYCQICKDHFPQISYFGIDYSNEAIKLARENWDDSSFTVMDYKELTENFISQFELIHMGAFLDVLPNGDEALDFILSLNPKSVYIGRMVLTKELQSYTNVYTAYNEIETVEYRHSENVIVKLINKHNYVGHSEYDFLYLEKV